MVRTKTRVTVNGKHVIANVRRTTHSRMQAVTYLQRLYPRRDLSEPHAQLTHCVITWISVKKITYHKVENSPEAPESYSRASLLVDFARSARETSAQRISAPRASVGNTIKSTRNSGDETAHLLVDFPSLWGMKLSPKKLDQNCIIVCEILVQTTSLRQG